MAVGSLDIAVGLSWKDDPRYLLRLASYSGDDEPFDFSPVLDIVDIVVDGANLTSRLPEESVFPVAHDLAEGVAALATGRTDKLIVPFHEAPWELAIRADGETAEVSFYAVGPSREVALHNRRVPLTQLVRSTRDAIDGMLRALLSVNSAFASERLVRDLDSALSELRAAAESGRVRGATAPTVEDVRLPGGIEHDLGEVLVLGGDRRLRLELRFDATYPELWRYQGALAADRHSLMCRASLFLRYWGRRREIARDAYVFPILSSLVGGAERVLDTLEQGAGGALILGTGQGVVSLLTAELPDAEHAVVRVTEPTGTHGQTKTTPEALLRVLIDTIRATIAAILRLNPRQGLNEPICDLEQRLARLEAQARDVLLGDIYFEGVQRFLREAPEVSAVSRDVSTAAELPHPLGAMRHLFVRSIWHLVRNHLDLAGLRVTDSDVFVPSLGWVDCVERATGTVRWRKVAETFHTLGEGRLFTSTGEVLSAWHQASGETAWEVSTEAAVEQAVLLRVGGRLLVVIAGEGGILNAFDATDGRPIWLSGLDHGDVAGLCVAGAVLVASGDDGFAYGFDPSSGTLLWKVRVPGDCAESPMFHEGRLYICADRDPGYEGVVYSISPLTGRRVFERRLASSFGARPCFVGRTGVFSLECPGATILQAVDLETGDLAWSLPLETAQLDAPVLRWVADTLVVKTDVGLCLGLDIGDGTPRWSTNLLEAGEVLLANVAPVTRGNHLIVAERWISILDPTTGARRSRLEQVPEHPGFLHVSRDMGLLVGDGDDHLECFDLRGFLALVE